MPSPYERSTRQKYPLPVNGLRQFNLRLDQKSFDQLIALKEQAGHTGTLGAFVRPLFADLINQHSQNTINV